MAPKDQLTFRQLQYAFFTGMSQYPNDKERLEQSMQVLVNWIDNYAERHRLIPVEGAKIFEGGEFKGGIS
jgi:hypothetical protein